MKERYLDEGFDPSVKLGGRICAICQRLSLPTPMEIPTATSSSTHPAMKGR